MKKIIWIIIFLTIISLFIIINVKRYISYRQFVLQNCLKGICNDNLHKCSFLGAYIYNGDLNNNEIERSTYKCIIPLNIKDKLFKLHNIFVPSMMYDTYCDMVSSTYYDYNDLIVLRNRIFTLNLPIGKCIRIRSYHFNPNKYIEIKYFGGEKIRQKISDDYELIEEDDLDKDNIEIFTNILQKIKSKKMLPIFNNTYKRLSFIYKDNPSIRITIDTNIDFFQNHIYKKFEKDIVEFKIPKNIPISEINDYIQEINELAGTDLYFTKFSKFEYYYDYMQGKNTINQ